MSWGKIGLFLGGTLFGSAENMRSAGSWDSIIECFEVKYI